MTLVLAERLDLPRGPSLLVATDSMLGAGYRWGAGQKLLPLGHDCVVAFEGNTEIAYPLMIRTATFIAQTDNLARQGAAPKVLARRVEAEVNAAYAAVLTQPNFDRTLRCSFLLAGWCPLLHEPVVQRLCMVGQGKFVLRDLTRIHQWKRFGCYFLGNGDNHPVARAASDRLGMAASIRLPGFTAFRNRLLDTNETSVGGATQICIMSASGREIAGTISPQGHRNLLGHAVVSGTTLPRYYREDLSDLA